MHRRSGIFFREPGEVNQALRRSSPERTARLPQNIVGRQGFHKQACRRGGLVVLRHKLPLGIIPGRWQVGFSDLPASPESITPGGVADAPLSQLQDLCYGFRAPLATLAATGMTA